VNKIAVAIALALFVVGSRQPAQAQTLVLPAGVDASQVAQVHAVGPPPLFAKMIAPAGADWWPPATKVASRGAALPSLYGSLIVLQAYDGYSTGRGLRNGAVESNGLMASLATHPGSLWAVKGASAFTSIYIAERLWRKQRRGSAIALMLVSNAIMVGVAANNAAVLRRQK
jgi:hypothetical protein